MRPRSLFVFEYLTGGGAAQDGVADPALWAMGRAMRDAVARDAAALPGWQVTVATAVRPVCSPGPGGPATTTATATTAAEQRRAPAPAGCQPSAATQDETVADHVARQAAQHSATLLIAPETGGLLATLQALVPAERWGGCSPAAIALASRKAATLAWLHRHGVATPLALAGRARLLALNHQQVDLDPDGRLAYGGVRPLATSADHPRWAAAAALVQQVAACVPGLRGFWGLDVVWHAQAGAVVIELNPRLTCAYVGLSARCGQNLAGLLLAGLGVNGDPQAAPATHSGPPAEADAHG
ncbi:MAG: hypothetical protein CFE45_17105 [Burkholderiales bacterium PBB5]|nr:MAG: hypothetical protein CFE45_17105 [Burkholderiales bacterium PBB5]